MTSIPRKENERLERPPLTRAPASISYTKESTTHMFSIYWPSIHTIRSALWHTSIKYNRSMKGIYKIWNLIQESTVTHRGSVTPAKCHKPIKMKTLNWLLVSADVCWYIYRPYPQMMILRLHHSHLDGKLQNEEGCSVLQPDCCEWWQRAKSTDTEVILAHYRVDKPSNAFTSCSNLR